VRHAWKSTGADAGCVLFLSTPAAAGALIEQQQRAGSGLSTMGEAEPAEMPRASQAQTSRTVAALGASQG